MSHIPEPNISTTWSTRNKSKPKGRQKELIPYRYAGREVIKEHDLTNIAKREELEMYFRRSYLKQLTGFKQTNYSLDEVRFVLEKYLITNRLENGKKT